MQTEVAISCDDGFRMPAVFTDAEPAGGGPRPGLVMIYEAYGMTDEMRRIARELGQQGWSVLMPDLFSRGPMPVCIARSIRALSRGVGQPLDDVDAARRWLAAHPGVDAERLGAIGFCVGGGFALALAITGKYRASAPFYGMAPKEMTRSCPVVASYGGQDRGLAKEPARLKATLTALGVPHDVKVYPEAGHSFATRSPGGALAWISARSPIHAGYHESSARDAVRRVVEFFHEHLDARPDAP